MRDADMVEVCLDYGNGKRFAYLIERAYLWTPPSLDAFVNYEDER